jgi:hypothetical protein
MPLDLYSKGTTDTLLAGKLDLSGGTMTGALNLSVSGIIFSDATYLTTAPAGSTLAADQLTAGVVTANPTTGPTASGDVLQYNGTDLVWATGGGGGLTISSLSNGATSTLDATVPSTGYVLSFDGTNLIWAAGGGGGGAVWGGITGTVTDQTDLTTYLSANYYPASNPSGFISSVPGKSVYQAPYGDYTLTSTDANNIVNNSGNVGNITIPQDSTYNFPIGTVIIVVETSNGNSVVPEVYGGAIAPFINGGVASVSIGYGVTCVKIYADTWSVF